MFVGSSGDWWILDSGCTFYIYHNISWFDIYKIVNDTILLGDNKEIFVIDVGTIQIRMHDGIVEILEIRHVPKLKKNYFLCFLLILNIMIMLLKMEFQGFVSMLLAWGKESWLIPLPSSMFNNYWIS